MFETVSMVFLGVLMVGAALLACFTKRAVSAIIASGVISLLASVVFLILAAPDVAMTEATIGAGLTTVIFLYALKHIRANKGGRDD